MMRYYDLFEEHEQLGIVVQLNPDGSFYDMDIVEYKSLQSLLNQQTPGHAKNIARSFIRTVQEADAWEEVFPLLKKSGAHTVSLGSDYSDGDETSYMFGPFTIDDISRIHDNLEQHVMFGDDESDYSYQDELNYQERDL